MLEQHERRILSRSHYRICKEECAPPVEEKNVPYPSGLDQSYFTPDLVKTSASVLDFLCKAKRIPELDQVQYVAGQMEEYVKFLLLQEEHKTHLIPSLPVQVVWFSHMLQSEPYLDFMENFNVVREIYHPVTRHLKPKKVEKLEARTKRLLAKKYPSTWNKENDAQFKRSLQNLQNQLTPQMVIDDRDWIIEYKKFTYGTDGHSLSLREKAHLGYQRFIYLKGTANDEVETIGLSPCPTIDLIWHTHLLHPGSYNSDMNEALGHVPKHKLLPVSNRTKVFMDTRDDKTINLWKRYFFESIFEYAVDTPHTENREEKRK